MSYAKEDEAIVRQIVSDLEAEGLAAWFAPASLTGGARLSTISEWLERSTHVLVMLSTKAVNSSWVHHEMNSAVALGLTGRSIITIPVLLERMQLPASVADLVAVDFILGDYRAKLLRIIAAINGTPPPMSALEAFKHYVASLLILDTKAVATIANAWVFQNGSYPPALASARRTIDETLRQAGVDESGRTRVLQDFDGRRRLHVVSSEDVDQVRSWVRNHGDPEILPLAAALWRGIRERLRGVTVRWIEEHVRSRLEKQTKPLATATLRWRAEALAEVASRAGLLATSTEYNDPRTYAFSDAKGNPSFDMGPMVWTIGRLADLHEDSLKTQ